MNEIVNRKFTYKKNKIYNKFLLILSNTILNMVVIIISLYIKELQFENWLFPFALLVLIQTFINISTIIKLEKKFFSLTTLFLIFSFITHFGILIIFGLKIDVDLPWNPLISITSDAFKDACYFTLFCHAFLTFGMCIILGKRKNYILHSKQLNIIQYENRELYLSRNIGIILILIGIIPMLYYDINRIILYIGGNYLSTYEVNVNGFVVTIGRMTEIGVLLLLISRSKNKEKSKLILILVLTYESLIMYTGNRGRPIMYLIVIFFIYYNLVKKIKFKEFVRIAIILYFAGFLLTFIGQIRMSSINNVETLIELVQKSFIKFSVFKILAEFGVTIITLADAMIFFPSTSPFQLGYNYLVSFLTILPNVRGILSPVINKIIYVNNWAMNVRQFLGGSYLGELYYSFGEFGFIFAIFIGMMVAFISNQINKCIIEKSYVKLSIYLMLFINLLWWIRGYFGDMVREFIWISVSVLILYKIFNNRYQRKIVKNNEVRI